MFPVRRLRRSSPAAVVTISAARARNLLKHEFNPEKALKIFSSIYAHDNSPESLEAQDITVRRLASAGRFSDIETLIESRKKGPRIKEEPFVSNLIQSYGLAGMFEHAIRTYDEIDEFGAERSCLSFNALLAACNRCDQFELVPQLFDEMPKRFEVVPDKVSYGILVKAYCEMEMPEKAVEIMRSMEELKVEVTAVTLTTALNALYKKGMVDDAKKIWNEMVVEKGCEVDVAAYNVRAMYVEGGRPEGVVAVIEEMAEAGLNPDAVSYNHLMMSYCRNEMMYEAEEVLRGMEGKGCNPNAGSYGILMFYLCQYGDFEKAYAVFKESARNRKAPDFGTVKVLARGLVKKRKGKLAKGLVETVKSKVPAISSLTDWKEVEDDLLKVSSRKSWRS